MSISGGVDIVEIRRIEKAIDKWGASFLQKIYTEREILDSRNRKDKSAYYAGRFAAKEAVYKTLPHEYQRNIYFTDIEITKNNDGKPRVSLRDKKGDFVVNTQINLSLSHCENYAVAQALKVDN